MFDGEAACPLADRGSDRIDDECLCHGLNLT
jgi:hypothetical protein